MLEVLELKLLKSQLKFVSILQYRKLNLKFGTCFPYWYQNVLYIKLNMFGSYEIAYIQPIWSTKNGHFLYFNLIDVTICLSNLVIETHLNI